ncbi:MAG: hypothetical protein AAB729_04200 [Patescibacteria group bacterium]
MVQTVFNKILFTFTVVGLLFGASFFCHFSGAEKYSAMGNGTVAYSPAGILSNQDSHCCVSKDLAQQFLGQLPASKPMETILALKMLLTFVALLALGYGFKKVNLSNNSRCREYSRWNFLHKTYNYILFFFSQGVLNPKIYSF